MKKLKLSTLMLSALTLILAACGGGGGGSGSVSTGGTYYTHDQLAKEFVRRVNSDVAGYDLELVKSNTLQTDYIVVYDWVYGTYDAYYIGRYNVGENLATYLWTWQDYTYYDLSYDSAYNQYVDPYSGVRFEKKTAGSKDLAKLKAFKNDMLIEKAASNLRNTYGLSESKSLDVARIAFHMNNAPAGSVSNSDLDQFAQELTGSSITDFQKDFKSGNLKSLQARIDKAAEVTGMGPEGTDKLIKDIFIK